MASKMMKTNELLPAVTEPARDVWFAGLGAVSVAEKEGGRFFRTLVTEGKKYERTNLGGVEKNINGMVDMLNARVEDLRAMPAAAMDRLGTAVDDSMTAVLHRLGIPTKREIHVLTRRVEELTKSLETRPARPVRPARPARAKRAPAKRRRRTPKTTA